VRTLAELFLLYRKREVSYKVKNRAKRWFCSVICSLLALIANAT